VSYNRSHLSAAVSFVNFALHPKSSPCAHQSKSLYVTLAPRHSGDIANTVGLSGPHILVIRSITVPCQTVTFRSTFLFPPIPIPVQSYSTTSLRHYASQPYVLWRASASYCRRYALCLNENSDRFVAFADRVGVTGDEFGQYQ